MAISLARILIHGGAGVGKTTFAAKSDRPVIIATEKDLSTIEVPHFPLATRRLADESDASQACGEVAWATGNRGNQWTVPGGNGAPASAAPLGLPRKAIHDARLIRDAEQCLDAILATGTPAAA